MVIGHNVIEGVQQVQQVQQVLATATCQTRTQAVYSPAVSDVSSLTSELDIVLTIPNGTTSAHLSWNIMGDVDTNAQTRTGFVVYRDIDGGGFSLLANSRDGSSNYYSVIAATPYDPNVTGTPFTVPVSIIDESPTVGSVATYRVYVANSSPSVVGNYYLNRPVSAVGNSNESGLSSGIGWALK